MTQLFNKKRPQVSKFLLHAWTFVREEHVSPHSSAYSEPKHTCPISSLSPLSIFQSLVCITNHRREMSHFSQSFPSFVRSFADPQQLSLIYAAQFGSYGATSLRLPAEWRQCGKGKIGLASARGARLLLGQSGWISPDPNSSIFKFLISFSYLSIIFHSDRWCRFKLSFA